MFEKEKFPTAVSYARKNLKTFKEEKFNEVDALIFSLFSYISVHENNDNTYSKKGMPIKELMKAEYFEEMYEYVFNKPVMFDLMVACVSSPRFRDVKIRYYRNELINERNLQFAALNFYIEDSINVIAYRGTDTSITGWKEDALLALDKPIPAQKMAVRYANEIAKVCDGDLYLVGHSKGGNLSTYAAAHCDKDVQDRIINAYSFDGPGFYKSELEYEGYANMGTRIKKFVPSDSIFGMLFDNEVEASVICSCEKGIIQHDGLSWKVKDNNIVTIKKTSKVSNIVEERLDNWVSTMTIEEKKIFVSTLFDLLSNIGAQSVDDFSTNIKTYIPIAINYIKNMDGERKKFMKYALKLMIMGDTEKQEDIDFNKLINEEDNSFDDDFDEDFSLYIK